jgi:3-deoxy-manno-octulosonate cytidylyltransferase (CMP-KDO synthetase)
MFIMMNSPLKYIGIIPARYASSRFPGKALAEINGKTMIRRVYEQASKALDIVYVATDDDRIFSNVRDFGGKVVMTSDLHKSGTDRCAEAVQLAESETGEKFDVVLNIQGDEPYIEPRQLELLKECFTGSGTQIATLAKIADSEEDILDPNRPKMVMNSKQEALYFSRFPIPYLKGRETSERLGLHIYYLHIGLYGFLKNVLLEITKLPASPLEIAESLEQLRWIENDYRIVVRITTYDSFGVDTPGDLERLLGRKSV